MATVRRLRGSPGGSGLAGFLRRPLAAPLAMAGWVVLTYGFRLGTAVAQRTWDSVSASVVLLACSAAVVVAAVRRSRSNPVGWERTVVRAFAALAAAWSVFRLATTWTGGHGAAFVAVHTVIAGVLLLLAAASWASTRGRGAQLSAAQRVPSAGAVPRTR